MPPWLDAVIDAILPPRKEVAIARTLTPESLRRILRPRLAKESWIMAFFEYQDESVRALIRAVKFYGDTKALPALAEVTSDFLMDMISDRREMAGWDTPLLVPIPSSKKRLKERGYNQADRIARALLPFLETAVTYAPAALSRHDRESQVRVAREERARNIKEAFFVPKPETVSGKQIILLDDVVETSSTMKDARRALRAAGASDILGIAIAH